MENVALGQVSPEYFQFPLSASFYQRSRIIYSTINEAIWFQPLTVSSNNTMKIILTWKPRSLYLYIQIINFLLFTLSMLHVSAYVTGFNSRVQMPNIKKNCELLERKYLCAIQWQASCSETRFNSWRRRYSSTESTQTKRLASYTASVKTSRTVSLLMAVKLYW